VRRPLPLARSAPVPRAKADQSARTAHSLKDRYGRKPAEYLHPDRSEADKAIQQAIRVALADRIMGGTKNNADLADDDDGEPGSGSESD